MSLPSYFLHKYSVNWDSWTIEIRTQTFGYWGEKPRQSNCLRRNCVAFFLYSLNFYFVYPNFSSHFFFSRFHSSFHRNPSSFDTLFHTIPSPFCGLPISFVSFYQSFVTEFLCVKSYSIINVFFLLLLVGTWQEMFLSDDRCWNKCQQNKKRKGDFL